MIPRWLIEFTVCGKNQVCETMRNATTRLMNTNNQTPNRNLRKT